MKKNINKAVAFLIIFCFLGMTIPILNNVSATIGGGDSYVYTKRNGQQTVNYVLENIFTNSSVIIYRESYLGEGINQTETILYFNRITRQSLDNPDYYLWAWIDCASQTILAGSYTLSLTDSTPQYYIYSCYDINGSGATFYYDRTTLLLHKSIEDLVIEEDVITSVTTLISTDYNPSSLMPNPPTSTTEAPIVQEARDYLTTLEAKLECRISTPEIYSAISNLSLYSSNSSIIQSKDVYHQVVSELHFLQTVTELKNQFIQQSAPENMSSMPVTIYPTKYHADCDAEGSAICNAEASIPDPPGQGYGATLTDSGFTWPWSSAWALSNLWFQTVFTQNVAATVTYNGYIHYAWIAIALWKFFSDAAGNIKASAYIYDKTDDKWNFNIFLDEDTNRNWFGIFGNGADSFNFHPKINNYYFKIWHEYCIGTVVESQCYAIKVGRCKVQSEWTLESMDFDPVS